MSELNRNVCWTDAKNDCSKAVLAQAPQQIFLLTVAYPQVQVQVQGSNRQALKSIGSSNESLPAQQHILLRPVDGAAVLPVSPPPAPAPQSNTPADGARVRVRVEEKDGRFAPLVVLEKQESTATSHVLPPDQHRPTPPTNHRQLPSPDAPTQIDQFELKQSSPGITFERRRLPHFASKSQEVMETREDSGSNGCSAPPPQPNKPTQHNKQSQNPAAGKHLTDDSEWEAEEAKQIIVDGPYIPRAKLTLPTDYLLFKNVHFQKDLMGVFAKKEIPDKAQFGPMKGITLPSKSTELPCPGLHLIILKPDSSKLVLSNRNEELSNWMRYVRVAFKAQEQNLALNQIDEELYFTSTRVIEPGQELRVWYSNRYAVNRNLPLLTKGKAKWRCCKCPFVSLQSKPMNQHLAQHRSGKLQNSNPVESSKKSRRTLEKDESQINCSDAALSNCEDCKSSERGVCSAHSTVPDFATQWSSDSQSSTASSLEDESDDIFEKGLVCELCGKVFVSSTALSLHYKSHCDTVSFECPLCQQTFHKVLDMKSHIATHKQNGAFDCTVCHKKFGTYRQVRKHIRLGHSKHRHKCTVCFKTFASSDRLNNHMLRHSSDKQFLCANCGKQFKRKDKLVTHTKRVHSKDTAVATVRPPKDPPPNPDYYLLSFKCLECKVGFKKRGVLVNHMLSRHPGTQLDSVPDLKQPILKQYRDYFCQYCDKVYKSNTKRKNHILKIHPGAKLPPSNQELRDDTYTQTVGSVSAEPQSCEWCSKQYASKAKLIQHQRKAHLNLMPKALRLPSVSSSKPSSQCAKKGDSPVDSSQEETDRTTEFKMTTLPTTNTRNNEVSGSDGIFLADGAIIVDGSFLKKVLKLGDPNMECVADSSFDHLLSESRRDQYFKILTQGGITIAQPVELWDPLNITPASTSTSTSAAAQAAAQALAQAQAQASGSRTATLPVQATSQLNPSVVPR